MNWRRRFFLIFAFVVAGVLLATSSESAKDNVPLSEFIKMSYGQRVAICARLVSSEDIGDCASISQPSGERFTAAEIHKISAPCFNKGLTDSKDIAACVHEKLATQGAPPEYPCLKDIARAYEICAATVDSTKIGTCTASLCTRLEVE